MSPLANSKHYVGGQCANAVQNRRQRFHAVDEPRSRSHHHGVSVNRPDFDVIRKAIEHQASLFAGLLETKAAGRDHDDIGPSTRDRFPGRGHGSLSGVSEYGFAPRGRHEVRNPMASTEGRIDPLQDENPAPG